MVVLEGQYFLGLINLSKYYSSVKCINHIPTRLCFHNNFIPHWGGIAGISIRPFRPHLGTKQAERLFWQDNIIFTRDILYNLSKWSSALIIHLHYGSLITSFSLSGRNWWRFFQGHLNQIFNTCQILTRVFSGIV